MRRWNSIRLSAVTQVNLARVLLYAGKLDEADAAGRKVAELQPSSAASHRWQVLVAVQRGDGEAALREAQLEPDRRLSSFRAGSRTLRARRSQGSRRGFADLIATGREGFDYQIAQVYAVRGETDKAFEWLQIAFDDHDGGMLSLAVDPLLRGLRDDPRYKNLLAKLGLPQRHEQQTFILLRAKTTQRFQGCSDLRRGGVAAD